MNAHDCYADGGVIGIGPKPCSIMGIGIAPGKHEWSRSKKPFTGPAGKLLDGTLLATGWNRDNIYLTNLICWWDDEPTPEEIKDCAPRLQQEIEQVNPSLIVLFGNIVIENFFGAKRPKRGRLVYKDNKWWLPTYHPAAFLHDGQYRLDIADFARDIGKIGIRDWSAYKPPKPDTYIADSIIEASSILWSVKGLTAIDVESSFDNYEFVYPDNGLAGSDDSKLLCLSVSNNSGTWVIPGEFLPHIRKGWGARDNVKWIMHNGLFDIAVLRRLLGEELKLSEDTLLMSYSLDERGAANEENERAVGPHGLKILASEFLGAEDYDVKVLDSPPEILHQYNARDSYYTRQLYDLFLERQLKDNVREMYNTLLIPGANILSEIQAYGVNVDKEVLFTLGAKWSKEWLALYEQLITESVELGWAGPDINLNSPIQLRKLIFNILGTRPHRIYGQSTRKEVLEELANDIPWCRTLKDWRAIDHVLNAYVTGVEDDIKYDGRLHPEPILHGTRSGRLSYHKPPIQTIPKHGVDAELASVRRMFSASSNDYAIIEADLRQAELWATAYLANDETMLNALSTGDAHGITAKDVFNVDENHPNYKALRELGKLLNFGTLYNRQAKSYARDMWQGKRAPNGLEEFHWSIPQAQRFINAWFEKYPKVRTWQKAQIREAFRNGEQISITGRKRRYWLPNFKTVNQSINIGPQGLAHDFLFDSFRKLHYLLKELDCHCLFEVHDAIVFEANKRWLDQSVSLINRIMTEPKFGLGGIPVDIAIGDNWHDVKKVAI